MLAERIRHIEQRILGACERSGRRREDVTLVAVTKTQPAERINHVLAEGLLDIGENRVQEYLAKCEQLQPHRFHMIGHLQRNKVKFIIESTVLIHSVDSPALADEIGRQCVRLGRTCDVLIEVNSSGEDSKFGVAPDDVPALAEHIISIPAVRLRGLMTVAAFMDDPERIRPAFGMMRGLRDTLVAAHPDQHIRELSMGMTNDFEIAIEEGATLIRIGSAIFGPRA
ncbi:MAG: YggS family pyridoxal phosphate-dependent enzyme [Bacteroidetes bacterium]|nr:YggS family pyridoxal phosphate-dependent enzyme [Bacteroidota bacterium]